LLGLDWQIQTIPAGFANPAGAANGGTYSIFISTIPDIRNTIPKFWIQPSD